MVEEDFYWKCTNHSSTLISEFSEFFNSGSLADVTLSAEGQQIQAHKVVLSAGSSFFQSLFIQKPCQYPIIVFQGVKMVDLKILINFMYSGEIRVPKVQLPNMLKTAAELKIKGLAEFPDPDATNIIIKPEGL